MWIKLDNSLFETNEHIDGLRQLLQIMSYKSKFNFFIDINAIENENIFEFFYPEINEIINQNYNLYIISSPSCKVTVSEDENGISIAEAIILLSNQFYIILEHSTYDGHFLDALLREFKGKSKKINQHKLNGWLDYQMGGGAENIITLLNGKDLNTYRCFVLVDSDKEFPLEPAKRTALENFCIHNNIPYHILEKREMENYMPLDIVEKNNLLSNPVKSYISLESVQQDFFDLQNGFTMSRRNLETEKNHVHLLYSNISETNYNNLRNGIKDEFQNFKRDFSELFVSATQQGLIQRTQEQNNPNELKEILDKITIQL